MDQILVETKIFKIHRAVDSSKFLGIYEWQNNYITDDDQNLILQIYFDSPYLFHLIQDNNWCSLYNILEHDGINK